jgi:PhzF family phenazine biosynthesis protein
MAQDITLWYNNAMTTRFYHVDAFTSEPYSGNPAVVCPLDGPADADWMQAVAAEMNVSETAFFYSVSPDGESPDGKTFALRWFTPTVEVDLCGHATLASAHVLRETGVVPVGQTARFETASGLLTVAITDDLLRMDFPDEHAEPEDAPAALVEGLGTTPVWVGRNRFDYVAELASADLVRDLAPDLRTLATLPGRGVIVTAPGDEPEIDYVCRVFGPKAGIPEDPATGSAQCALGPYWAKKLGKPELAVHQVSKRGGHLWVRPEGERVLISGQAVTTSAGELLR